MGKGEIERVGRMRKCGSWREERVAKVIAKFHFFLTMGLTGTEKYDTIHNMNSADRVVGGSFGYSVYQMKPLDYTQE